MLMVIFGAGATFDSAPRYPARTSEPQVELDRPPLADQLFDEKPPFAAAMDRFKACRPLISPLRYRSQGVSVEQALSRLQGTCLQNDQGRREMVAIRFYLQFMIRECVSGWENRHNHVTNYYTLLHSIRQNRKDLKVAFVTFNYDTMLEDALSVVMNLPIKTIDDYVKSPEYKLFKVHGSVNWGRSMTGVPFPDNMVADQFTNEMIRFGNIILQGDCVTKHYSLTEDSGQDQEPEPLFPAIAIPVETKAEFECPDKHLSLLKSSIREITKILIIGWRGMDPHFIQILLDGWHSDIRVQIVCGGVADGDSVRKTMEAAGLTGRYEVKDFGFTNYARDGHAEKFLKE